MVADNVFQEPKPIGVVNGGEFCSPMRIAHRMCVCVCVIGIEKAEREREREREREVLLNMEKEEHLK